MEALRSSRNARHLLAELRAAHAPGNRDRGVEFGCQRGWSLVRLKFVSNLKVGFNQW